MKNVLQSLAYFRQGVTIEKSGVNTYHNNSKYHTIDDLMNGLQRCADYGISWYQTFNGNDLLTTITHIDSGESIESRVYIGDYNEAQKWAGAVTYKRRITLVTMFGLSEPDADGNETINTPAGQSKPVQKFTPPKDIDHDYSGPPYRLMHIDGSTKAELTDIKAWGLAMKKALTSANADARLPAANANEVGRVLVEVNEDENMHHKTKDALSKAIGGLMEIIQNA